MKRLLLFLLNVVAVATAKKCLSSDDVWRWECRNSTVTSKTRVPRCVKVLASDASSSASGLNECKLTCGKYAALFPKPSGTTLLGKDTMSFYPINVQLGSLQCLGKNCSSYVKWLFQNSFQSFRNTLDRSYKSQSQKLKKKVQYKCKVNAILSKVKVNVDLKSNERKITLQTDESYQLNIQKTSENSVQVTITATNFFGARHGLETMSQLTAYDESVDSLQILTKAQISDKPSYKYRGLLLDTSRNYFSVKSIKRLIQAMSYSKLNTLHWHITDTHSFPIEIKSVPNLMKYGAYSTKKIYKHSDVQNIVGFATYHGVRILPEFDEPAHCGEGWQWGEKAGLGKLAVCVNREPWQKYCVEPPCGQLNPTNDNLYDVLKKIYQEYFDIFKPDLFHAGGDEVNMNCWNTTKEITDWMMKNYGGCGEEDFLKLWGMFLKKSSDKIYEANHKQSVPLILWTSKMTDQKYLNKYMDPAKHIIQLWTGSTDSHISNVVTSGFKTIFSTYDTLYLDCGYGNWLVKGNNWCSPYKDWKLLYDNDPVKILQTFNITVTPKIRDNILGQEAAMWSEQVDEFSSEGKIWPRTAALAERLWTNPDHDWRDAESRFIYHRGRLVNRGINADAIQPLWCKQNDGHCYYDSTIQGQH